MPGFLSAHGYDPGPTQRPLLAGAISGVLATLPAVAILALLPSLEAEATILGLTKLVTVGAGAIAMAAAGAVYGRLFGRAANDRRGGWLFGMAFGFALWAGGAVMILPLASGGLVPAGQGAVGVFLSLIAWGATLGLIYPVVHRPLHESLASASQKASVGPDAATARGRSQQRLKPRPASPKDRRPS